jgi:DNA-binding response OmpR family regulator
VNTEHEDIMSRPAEMPLQARRRRGARSSADSPAAVGLETPPKVLVIESCPNRLRYLRDLLRPAMYQAWYASTAHEGVTAALNLEPEAVLVASSLPECAGTDLVTRLRSLPYHNPILVLASHHTREDVARDLRAGADDCLSEPFHGSEFLARLAALLRRARYSDGDIIDRCSSLAVSVTSRRAWWRGHAVTLTQREADVLCCLVRNNDTVVPSATILRTVWGDAVHDPGVVAVYINYLRKKLERVGAGSVIVTTTGGYKLVV